MQDYCLFGGRRINYVLHNKKMKSNIMVLFFKNHRTVQIFTNLGQLMSM